MIVRCVWASLFCILLGTGCSAKYVNPRGQDWTPTAAPARLPGQVAIYIPDRDFQFRVPSSFGDAQVALAPGLNDRMRTTLANFFETVNTTSSDTQLRVSAKDPKVTYFGEFETIRIGFNRDRKLAFCRAYAFFYDKAAFGQGEPLSLQHESKVSKATIVIESEVESEVGDYDAPAVYESLLTKVVTDVSRKFEIERTKLK